MFSLSIIVIYQPGLIPGICSPHFWWAGIGLGSLSWGWMCFNSTSLTFWVLFQFHPEPVSLSHHLIHFPTTPVFYGITSLLTTQDGYPQWVYTSPQHTQVDLTLPAHPYHLPTLPIQLCNANSSSLPLIFAKCMSDLFLSLFFYVSSSIWALWSEFQSSLFKVKKKESSRTLRNAHTSFTPILKPSELIFLSFTDLTKISSLNY